MNNNWIVHVKNYAKENNISYKEALSGGSIKSDVIARILKNNPSNFDVSKIKEPSNNLIKRFKKEEQPQKKIKPKVLDFLNQIETKTSKEKARDFRNLKSVLDT